MGEREIAIKLDVDQTDNNIKFSEMISLNNDSKVNETSRVIEQTKQSSEDDEPAADDHDDVPGDFFDDFLKEDFMAGLDVVDEDEGEERNECEEEPLKTSKKKKISIEEKPERKQIHIELENNDLRQLLIKEKEKRNSNDLRNVLKGKVSRKQKKAKLKPQPKMQSKVQNKPQPKSKSKPKSINADEFDIRRDPTKTKRDIERDKARCEKDKEKKIISEKLKLVETGLVPPGMEMETDLDDIKKQKDKNEEKTDNHEETKTSESKGSKTNLSSRRRSNSRSPRTRKSPRLRRSPLRRSPVRLHFRSPFRRISPKRSPLRRSPRRSPRRDSLIISPKRSPLRRRSRERSPRRSRERSPRRSRERSPRRSRERSPRRSRERSPRRIREESPRSRDRSTKRIDTSLRRSIERLDRERNRRSRSRDKFRGPWHRRSRSRSPKRRHETEKKKSFLQEIADKLNETRPVNIPYQHMMHLPTDIYHVGTHAQGLLPTPIPGPAPVPVPPPVVNQFQSQQQYDQSFFIGTPPALPSPNVPINMPQNGPPHQMQMNMAHPPPIMQNAVPSTNDVSKLFQDKKITLTEFLSITAKPEIYSASSAHMKEKIKVISRCQEAIKYLGNSEKKLTGPFVVQKAVKPNSPSDKFKSPLLKSAQIKLPFTEVPKSEQYKSQFNSHIDNLLKTLGLAKEEEEVIIIDDPDPVPQEPKRSPPVATPAAPPPPPNISFGRQAKQIELPRPPEKYKLSKFVQTNAPVCIDCDRRKKISYKNVGTQCGNDGVMFSVGTQASDDDFYTRMPTSQSLASLTPAQLLARSGMSKPGRNFDEKDFDLQHPVRKPPARPAGYAYGSDVFGGSASSRYSPPKFASPTPPARAFDAPAPGGMRANRLPDLFDFDPLGPGGMRGGNRPEVNRYSFNNYY